MKIKKVEKKKMKKVGNEQDAYQQQQKQKGRVGKDVQEQSKVVQLFVLLAFEKKVTFNRRGREGGREEKIPKRKICNNQNPKTPKPQNPKTPFQ